MSRPLCLLLLSVGLLAVGGALWFFFCMPSADSTAPTPQAESQIEVGFGDADITPTVGAKPVYMAGFGSNRKATGIHDRLHARTVVVGRKDKKIAIVSIDVIGFFYPNVVSVRQELRDFRYVLVTSTHSHEGPDTMGLWGPTPFQSGVDAEYMQRVEKQIVASVRMADETRRPARAVLGTALAPELLHDGRLPLVKHDELVALEFRELDNDRPMGVVVQWNCHPETLDSKNTLISADFVGYAVNHLREKRGCPVVYLTGTVGGLMTSLKVDIKGPDGQSLKDGTYEKTEKYGHLVAEVAERALEKAVPMSLRPFDEEHRLIYLPIENKYYQLARTMGVVKREAFVWDGNPSKAAQLPLGQDAKLFCLQTELAYLRLGELEIACVPGEIYPELVLGKVQDPADAGADYPDAPVEAALYKQLRGPHRMIIGLANDEIGYIIPKRQWDEKPPYCYGRTQAQYGEINSLGPDTAPFLCEAFRDLMNGRR